SNRTRERTGTKPVWLESRCRQLGPKMGYAANIHSRALPVASPSKAPKEMIATTMIIQLIPSLSRQKTNADERANTATSRIVKTNLTCIPRMHHGWQIHPHGNMSVNPHRP